MLRHFCTALQELWRLKITRAGRILFEVAVEYDEESRTWAEMIRLWVGSKSMTGSVQCSMQVNRKQQTAASCSPVQQIASQFYTAAPEQLTSDPVCGPTFLSPAPLQQFVTLDHKAYEAMIGLVRASFRRTLAMRERLQLQPVADDTCAAAGKAGSKAAGGKGPAAPKPAAAGGSRDTQRLPRHYKEADPSVAREWRKQQQQQQQQERQLPQQPGGAGATPGSTVSLREQFPPASWADDSYTLMKASGLGQTLSTLTCITSQALDLLPLDPTCCLSCGSYMSTSLRLPAVLQPGQGAGGGRAARPQGGAGTRLYPCHACGGGCEHGMRHQHYGQAILKTVE